MCASRFAHYVKMLGRQMVGSFKTAEEIEDVLDTWIKQFVRGNAPYETRSRYPLIGGKVSVHELPSKPRQFWLHGVSAAALSDRRRRGFVPTCNRSRRAMTREEHS